jgi:hypothetical protein
MDNREFEKKLSLKLKEEIRVNKIKLEEDLKKEF